jgi:HPt (histidine-containing phosphotransfer) domain-containing protein
MPVQPDPAGGLTVEQGNRRPSIGAPTSSLNRAALIARFGGDDEFFGEVATVFLEDFPRMLRELQDACASQDLAALRTTAHAFKGAISHFTDGEAYAAAAALERLAEAGRSDAFTESRRVEGLIATFAEALRAARDQ